MIKIAFKSKEGFALSGVWHLPKDKTTKAIVLAHGITVDKDENGVFIELANALEQNGYAVFRFDFRGHGESEGKSVDMTIEGEIADLEAAFAEVKSKGYEKIGLLGASFGGGSSVLYTSKHKKEIKCLCLWNPVLNYEHTFLNPTLPWIRSRKEHVKKDIREKGWTTLGSENYILGEALFKEMARLIPYQALSSINIPTIIIHGTKDSTVPYEDSRDYVGHLPNGKLITIEGAAHGFHNLGETEKAIEATINFFLKSL
jgi:uncharacterized protein